MHKAEITKVKFKDGRVEIYATQKIGTVGDDAKMTVLRCSDEPAASFDKAFDALVDPVREILELEPGQWKHRITVTGVSFSMSDDGVEGAVVTGLVKLDTANSPFSFNTPHLPYQQYSPTGESPLMPEDAQAALNELKREAEAYLAGKRAQGDLFRKDAA